jgi:hypothetical protein
MPGNLRWKYVDVDSLQQILSEKIDQGYTFPMNVKWVLCDSGGWSDIYDKLLASGKKNVPESMDVWYPREVRERIDAIRARHPKGFRRQRMAGADDYIRQSNTAGMDLALEQLRQRNRNSSMSISTGLNGASLPS